MYLGLYRILSNVGINYDDLAGFVCGSLGQAARAPFFAGDPSMRRRPGPVLPYPDVSRVSLDILIRATTLVGACPDREAVLVSQLEVPLEKTQITLAELDVALGIELPSLLLIRPGDSFLAYNGYVVSVVSLELKDLNLRDGMSSYVVEVDDRSYMEPFLQQFLVVGSSGIDEEMARLAQLHKDHPKRVTSLLTHTPPTSKSASRRTP